MRGEREVTALPAATVTLVRDSARGLEVLLMQRNLGSGFMPGMYVFPGGALDASDDSAELYSLCAGLDEAAASRVLGVKRGGLAYWIAAIREAFEEAGILLAYDAGGGFVALDGAARRRFLAHRQAQEKGHAEFGEMARSENLRLAADRLTYFSHWITPLGAPRRYDTRFFVAAAPQHQEVVHDDRETVAHVWIRPVEALDRHRSGEYKMRTPTLHTLERFAGFNAVAALIAALGAQRDIPAILPRLAKDGGRLLPGEPGYEEAGNAGARGEWRP